MSKKKAEWSAPGYRVSDFEDGKLVNAEMKRLNPKFQFNALNVDKLEEAEQLSHNGLNQGWKHPENRGAFLASKRMKRLEDFLAVDID
ncbi:unnamed protein product [Gongylonema pulchrum]|uniref:HNH endonuclease n=1 Tax=Gongylonema pulchrum TaxID=637853 RepID=A0A183EXP5_9BILA|nr:unnamed protein product [Gongylonema pulchrum]